MYQKWRSDVLYLHMLFHHIHRKANTILKGSTVEYKELLTWSQKTWALTLALPLIISATLSQ